MLNKQLPTPSARMQAGIPEFLRAVNGWGWAALGDGASLSGSSLLGLLSVRVWDRLSTSSYYLCMDS